MSEAAFGWCELGCAGALLWLLGVVVYGTHIVHGGLYSDDWSLGALYRFPTTAGHLRDFLNIEPARPVRAVWLLLTYALFGTHAVPQLALSLALGLLAATLFYAVLRTLGVVRLHAWLIAALALLFPQSDADRLWYDASPAMLSTAFCCVGLLLMLRAFRHRGRRSLWRHLASVAFYAMSIMTYETSAPLIVVSACLLVWRRAPRRDVLKRSAVDLVVALLILKFVTSQTPKQVDLGLGAMWTHAKAIFNQGLIVFAESFFPFYSEPDRRLATVLGALIIVAGVVALRLLAPQDPDRALMGHGLKLIAGGAVVTVLGWVMFLPGNVSYSPAAGGDGSRVNGAAGFGMVILVFGLLLTLGVLLLRGLRGSPRTASVAASAAAMLIGVGYTNLLVQDIHKWDAANTIRSQVLGTVHRLVPHPASGSMIFATGFVLEPYANIGSFDYPWDLRAALRVTYSSSDVTGGELLASRDLECGARELTPLIAIVRFPNPPVPYGTSVYLVDVGTGTLHVISSRQACLAAGGVAA